MDKVKLGKIVKLHGYLGAFKVKTSYDKDFEIKNIKNVFDKNDNLFEVERIFKTKDGVVIKIKGLNLENVKLMIGSDIYIEREVVGNKILIEDLKGATVQTSSNKILGKIYDVEDYGSAEVFFAKSSSNKDFMFPNVKGLILNFDFETKILTIDEKRFGEVCEYED